MHSEQDHSGPQPRHHFITWGAFFKKDCGSDHSSRNVRSGSKTSVWFLLAYEKPEWEPLFTQANYSPKLTTVCNPNLSHPLWGFGQGFLTLLWLHFSTWLSLQTTVILSFCMNLCAHFAHHHNIYIPFLSFVHPKDTLASVRKMLFFLSVSSMSKLQDQAYGRCLVNHCGLNKVFWAPEWPLFRKPLLFLGCWVSWDRASFEWSPACCVLAIGLLHLLSPRKGNNQRTSTHFLLKMEGYFIFMWPKKKKERERERHEII